MSFQYAELGDTVYMWFAVNDTSGSGNDGATPLCDVRLAGAEASAAPVLSPTPALLSHANYPNGAYEVAIAATTGNGFVAESVYAVFSAITVSSQNPTGFIGAFRLSRKNAGLGALMCETTIATLASQTSFTLTDASADNGAYPVGSTVIVTDATTPTQKAVGFLSSYTGATKTVSLIADPGVFTMAVGDRVEIIAPAGTLKSLMPESYPPDGQPMTAEQALYGMVQGLTEFVRSGAVVTVRKRDAVTAAYTLTWDSPTTPTTSTQSS